MEQNQRPRVGIIGNLTQQHLELAAHQLAYLGTVHDIDTLVTLGDRAMDGLVVQYVRTTGCHLSAVPQIFSERGIDWSNLNLASQQICQLWAFCNGEDPEFVELCQRFRFFDIPITFIVL
jgi:hypothetical protein